VAGGDDGLVIDNWSAGLDGGRFGARDGECWGMVQGHGRVLSGKDIDFTDKKWESVASDRGMTPVRYFDWTLAKRCCHRYPILAVNVVVAAGYDIP